MCNTALKCYDFHMPPAPSISGYLQTFDNSGRPVRLTESEVRERNRVALAALDAIEQMGDDGEQRETLEYLMRAVDDDRLSARPRFGP